MSSCANEVADDKSYFDASLNVEERVELLIQQMTLEEKVVQLRSKVLRRSAALEEGFSPDEGNLYDEISNGIGQLENTFDDRPPEESASRINRIQQFLRDSTRLKIPALVGSECLHGHVGYNSTIFPIPLAMACSWDPELVSRVYDVIGKEARMRGAHEAHTPVLDIGRDPRWGRVEETFGEDTHLVTTMGVAAVTGLQGGNAGNPGKTHIISSSKHFAGYGQVLGGRNFAPTPIDIKTLQDEIFPPFKAVVTEVNGLGIMPSHCEVNGIPAHGNKWLLSDILKEQWGFEGIVVSDYNDVKRLEEFHHVVGTPEEAAKQALMAGLDVDLPAATAYRHLVEVIKENSELISYLDNSVRRVLRLKFMLGLFEAPFVDPDAAKNFVGQQEHVALAKEIADQSIVLLKNEDGLLPLKMDQLKTIAVIGPNANSKETGSYSAKSDHVVSILEGVREKTDGRVQIAYAKGCEIATIEKTTEREVIMRTKPLSEEETSIQGAVNVAASADVAIVCIGGLNATSREATYRVGDKGDRSSVDLLGNQEELIKRIAETGTPIVLVLMGGKPYSIAEVEPQVDAIVSTFYLGQQTGGSLSDALFGDINPSGKLAISFPRSVGQIPVYYSQKATSFYKDYLEEPSGPLFPFGYGLSYTSFEMGVPEFEEVEISKNDTIRFRMKVTNTGDISGAEVVQVYFRDQVASVPRPEKLLVRYEKVFLKPGEEQWLAFEIIPEKDLSFTGMNNKQTLEPGEFEFMIGNSSENILHRKIVSVQ